MPLSSLVNYECLSFSALWESSVKTGNTRNAQKNQFSETPAERSQRLSGRCRYSLGPDIMHDAVIRKKPDCSCVCAVLSNKRR